ncbi:hypothetical protein V8G54_028983 [Vigna mungo]|uniref:C2H2-type domain-containing protein n=1 Tax=Vigna mungo TaxID=3915 RepID=A0AAQ3MTA0_VIGMU
MLDLNETPSEEIEGAASERYSRRRNQPDAEYIWTNLSEEQKLVASNSFNVYCKPVLIYNEIQSRVLLLPLFIIFGTFISEVSHVCQDSFRDACTTTERLSTRRGKIMILMTVLLSWKVEEIQSLFPMCICLGRLLDPSEEPTGEEKYEVRRIFTFEGPTGIDSDGINHVRVNFMLPHIEKLAVETNYDKYFLLILASAKNPISLSTVNASTLTSEVVSVSNESSGGEKCLYGKVSLKFLYEILNISPDSPLQYRTEIQFSTELRSCNLKYWLKHYTRKTTSTISIRDSNDSEVDVTRNCLILLQEEGYYHDMLHRLEVTENFTCAICLVQCINYKSLKLHLRLSHQIFRFEFSESEEFPSVSVSVKNENWWREFIDPKVDTFMYCIKKPKSRKLKTSSHGRYDTDSLVLDVELIANAQLMENMDISLSKFVSDDGSNAIQQDHSKEVSNNVMLHMGPSNSNQNDQTLTTLEVEQEQVSNAVSDPSQCYVSSVSDDDETCGVQEVDHDETLGVQEVDNEEISNAIKVYTGEDCIPAISDHGALAVLEDDVSNATILHTNEDHVSPVSDHDNGVDAMQQDEVSNALILHPSPDFVPYVPTNEGTSSVQQAEEKEKLLSERYDPDM